MIHLLDEVEGVRSCGEEIILEAVEILERELHAALFGVDGDVLEKSHATFELLLGWTYSGKNA